MYRYQSIFLSTVKENLVRVSKHYKSTPTDGHLFHLSDMGRCSEGDFILGLGRLTRDAAVISDQT